MPPTAQPHRSRVLGKKNSVFFRFRMASKVPSFSFQRPGMGNRCTCLRMLRRVSRDSEKQSFGRRVRSGWIPIKKMDCVIFQGTRATLTARPDANVFVFRFFFVLYLRVAFSKHTPLHILANILIRAKLNQIVSLHRELQATTHRWPWSGLSAYTNSFEVTGWKMHGSGVLCECRKELFLVSKTKWCVGG